MSAEAGLMTVMNDLTSFEVSAASEMLNGIEEEQEVRVYYEGALSGISVEASKIEIVEN